MSCKPTNTTMKKKKGKLIIFSAPSGSGKSTIINYLMQQGLHLHFSISATSRAPRGTEKNGVEYFFLTPEEFRQKIANDEFVEYEEVYADKFYGTLKSQVENQLIEELRRRLEGRGTDTQEVIESRLEKAAYEITFAPKFDKVVVNDVLETAQAETLTIVREFLNK